MPQPPSAASVSSTHVRGLRRVGADVRKDCGHILSELLLTASRQCVGRRNDLHADRSCDSMSRRLDHRWFHPVNERCRVLQVERTGRAHTFGAQDRPRQLLAIRRSDPDGRRSLDA